MAKKDNVEKTATQKLMGLFSELTIARQEKGRWSAREDALKDEIRDATGNATGVTFMTKDGIEVGSVDETDPTQSQDYKSFCKSDFFQEKLETDPELRAEYEKYLKPATTSVIVRSKYAQVQKPQSAPVRKRTTVAAR